MPDENQRLTVTIKTVADTSGAQQVSQSLQKVQQQAQQTGQQGAQVANQLVRSLVQQHGATQESFQRAVQSVQQTTGVRPTITPASLGITTQTVQAAGQVAQQTERAAQSSRGLSSGLQEAARVGAGLFGIGLGLNLAATAAQKVSELVVGLVQGQIDYERTVRETNVLWGAQASTVQAIARAQGQMADQSGTTQEHLQAINALGAATLQFPGTFTVPELARAPAAGFRLSQALGEDEQARQARQEAIRQYITRGGGSLQGVGIAGTSQETAGFLGLRSEQGLAALTPSDLARARELAGVVALNRAALSATGPGGDSSNLVTKQADAQKALDDAQSALRTRLEGSGTQAHQLALAWQASTGMGLVPSYEADTARQTQLQQTFEAAQQELEKWTAEVGNAHTEIAKATDELNKLGVSANSATARLLDFTGSVEDLFSIARGDIAAQAQGAVAQRAQPVNPLIAQTPQEMFVTASQRADQDAYRQFVAQQAQQQLLQNSPIRDFLEQQANQQGPGLESQRAAAQAALQVRERRRTGLPAEQIAQAAGQLADRATTEANAQLQRIQITQDERRLAVQDQVVDAKRRELEIAGRLSSVQLAQATIQAQATLASGRLQSIQLAESNRRLQYADQQADLQKESIQLQQQMSPLLLQQANLQDRMALASRDNLDIRKQLISAEQAALPSEGALSELDYAQQRIQLQAQVRQAAAIRGQSTAGMPSFAALTRGFVQGELNRPGVELQALDARQQVARAQQASTAAGLGQQMTQTDLEAQARAIQDQLMPLQEAQRAEQARSEALQQMLDLMDLQDTKAKTAAESAVNLAQQQLIAINQTLVPLQLQSEFAQAAGDAIQRTLDLMNLNDAPAQAFWQTMLDSASQLKLDSEAASRAANDFSAGLVLGVDPAEKIRASLQQGADALLSINNLNNGAGGVGITPYGPSMGGPGSGVNLGGITVNIGAGGNTEAIVDQAVGQFEVQFRQALRASGSAAPPISSSVVGARRG